MSTLKSTRRVYIFDLLRRERCHNARPQAELCRRGGDCTTIVDDVPLLKRQAAFLVLPTRDISNVRRVSHFQVLTMGTHSASRVFV